jgi:hypothetical protein
VNIGIQIGGKVTTRLITLDATDYHDRPARFLAKYPVNV